jgi:hypothetical protein
MSYTLAGTVAPGLVEILFCRKQVKIDNLQYVRFAGLLWLKVLFVGLL